MYDKEIKDLGFIKEFKNSKGEIARQTVVFSISRFEKILLLVINCFSGGVYSYGLKWLVLGDQYGGIKYSTDEEFKHAVETYADILKKMVWIF
ncbi:hypothetical protein ABFV83_10915 [Lacrimispora sp. BS-2]|uniref:Uncharacterized protein n=1 Tax=Lacrimispora sp. BS-2 TaxID=3151850 RepID=A0AAU7PL57_9FIRM